LRHLLAIHERDRRSLAYDVHDGLAQDLTGALLRLQAFRELLKRSPYEAWPVFDASLDLLSRCVERTRNLIATLRPPILDESGIVAAIDFLVCDGRRPGGPRVEFVHDVPSVRMPDSVESAIFRIVQEALANARRHSQSEKVRLELCQKEGRLSIDVRDWGVGFDSQSVAPHRFGLRGIRERARLLGGTAQIESRPGEGTRVHVELPVAQQGDDAWFYAETNEPS